MTKNKTQENLSGRFTWLYLLYTLYFTNSENGIPVNEVASCMKPYLSSELTLRAVRTLCYGWLRTLEKEKVVTSYLGNNTPEEAHFKQRYWYLTELGIEQVKSVDDAQERCKAYLSGKGLENIQKMKLSKFGVDNLPKKDEAKIIFLQAIKDGLTTTREIYENRGFELGVKLKFFTKVAIEVQKENLVIAKLTQLPGKKLKFYELTPAGLEKLNGFESVIDEFKNWLKKSKLQEN